MKKLLLQIFCIFLLGSVVPAQDKTKSVDELQKQIKTFKKSGKYKVDYDKFKDVTTVSTEKYYIEYFGVSAAFTFAGKELKSQPDAIALIFTAYGGQNSGRKGWRFLDDSELTLLIDDSREKIGDGERDSDFARGIFGESMTKERLLYKIDIDTFEKMADAKTIEFQIAKEEGKFNAAILEMFKNLYALTETK